MVRPIVDNKVDINQTALSMGEGKVNDDNTFLSAFSIKAGAQSMGERGPSGSTVTDRNITAPMTHMSILGESRKTAPPLPIEDIVLRDLRMQQAGKVFSQHDEETGLLMSLEGLYWRKDARGVLDGTWAETRDGAVLSALKTGNASNQRIFTEYFTEISDSQNINGSTDSKTLQTPRELINGQSVSLLLNGGFYQNFHGNASGQGNKLHQALEIIKDANESKYLGLEALQKELQNTDSNTMLYTADASGMLYYTESNHRVHTSNAGYWCSPVQVASMMAAQNDSTGNYDVVLDGYVATDALGKSKKTYKGRGTTSLEVNPSAGELFSPSPSVVNKSELPDSQVTPPLFWEVGDAKQLSADLVVARTHGDLFGLIPIRTKPGPGNTTITTGVPGLHYQVFDGKYGGYFFNFWEYWQFDDTGTHFDDGIHKLPPANILSELTTKVNTLLGLQGNASIQIEDDTRSSGFATWKQVDGVELTSPSSTFVPKWSLRINLNSTSSTSSSATEGLTYSDFYDELSNLDTTIRPLFSDSHVNEEGAGESFFSGDSETYTTNYSGGETSNSHFAPKNNQFKSVTAGGKWSLIRDLLLPHKDEFVGGRAVGVELNTIYYDLSTTPYKYTLDMTDRLNANAITAPSNVPKLVPTSHTVSVYLNNMHNDGGSADTVAIKGIENPSTATAVEGAINGFEYYNKYEYVAPFGYILKQESGIPEDGKRFLNATSFGSDAGSLYSASVAEWSPTSESDFVKKLWTYISTDPGGPRLDIFRKFSSVAPGAASALDHSSAGTPAAVLLFGDNLQEEGGYYNDRLLPNNWENDYNLAVVYEILKNYAKNVPDGGATPPTEAVAWVNFFRRCAMWCKYFMRYNKTLPDEIVTDIRGENESLLRLLSKGYTYSEIPFEEYSESVWQSKMSWSEYLWAKKSSSSGGVLSLTNTNNNVYDCSGFVSALLPDALFRAFKQCRMSQYALNHFNGFSPISNGNGEGSPDASGVTIFFDYGGSIDYNVFPDVSLREEWSQENEWCAGYNFPFVYNDSGQLGYKPSSIYFATESGKTGSKYYTYSKILNNNNRSSRVGELADRRAARDAAIANGSSLKPLETLGIHEVAGYQSYFNYTWPKSLMSPMPSTNGASGEAAIAGEWGLVPSVDEYDMPIHNVPTSWTLAGRLWNIEVQGGYDANSFAALAWPFRLPSNKIADSYLTDDYKGQVTQLIARKNQRSYVNSICLFYYAGTIAQLGGMDMHITSNSESNAIVSADSTLYVQGNIVASKNIIAHNKIKIGSAVDMVDAPERIALKCYGKAQFSDILLTTIPKLLSTTATSTEFLSSSDIRLKKNVKTIASALDKIISMRGCEWNWKENNNRTTGVIAQEIVNIDKDVVMSMDGNILSVNYNALSGYFIEAIKEQQLIIESQDAAIEELNEKINTLLKDCDSTTPNPDSPPSLW